MSILYHGFTKALRYLTVILIWTFFTPFVTFKIAHLFLYFHDFGWTAITQPYFILGTLIGVVLCVLIFFSFLIVTAFKDFMQQNPDLFFQFAAEENPPDPNNMRAQPNNEENQRHLRQDINELQQPVNDLNDPEAVAGLHRRIQRLNELNNQFLVDEQQQQQQQQQIQDVELEEIIGFNAPWWRLFETILFILMTNIVVLFSFLFVPSVFGYLYHYLEYGEFYPTADFSVWNRVQVVCIGYGIIVVSVSLWLLFSYLFNRNPDPFTKYCFVIANSVYSFLKLMIFTFLQFIFIPLFCGNVMDFATVEYFGTLWESRMAYFMKEPLSYLIVHWILGVSFVVQLSLVIMSLRLFLRKEVLWFLNNPEDPQFNFWREVLRNRLIVQSKRFAGTLFLFTTIIFGFMRSPLKLARFMFPSQFPLSIGVSEPLIQSALDMSLVWLISNAGIEDIRFYHVSRMFMRMWLERIGEFLSLNGYLFPSPIPPPHLPQQEHHQQQPPHAQNNDNGLIGGMNNVVNPPLPELQQEATEPERPPFFILRICLLLLFGWATATLFISFLIITPVFIGKKLLALFWIRLPNDMYAWVLGFYLCLTVIYIIRNCLLTSLTGVKEVLSTLRDSLSMFIQVGLLGSLSFILLPILAGLCWHSTLIYPFFVRADQNPLEVHSITEIWAFGCLDIVLWVRSTQLFRHFGLFENWREEYDLMKLRGFRQMETGRIIEKLIFPLFYYMVLYLALPGIITHFILPSIVPFYCSLMARVGGGSNLFFMLQVCKNPLTDLDLLIISKHVFPYLGLLVLGHQSMKIILHLFTMLHNFVRDEQFLVERRILDRNENNQ